MKGLRDEVLRIEGELERVSSEADRLAALLSDPKVYSSGGEIAGIVREFEAARASTAELEAAWERAAASLEEASSAEAVAPATPAGPMKAPRLPAG